MVPAIVCRMALRGTMFLMRSMAVDQRLIWKSFAGIQAVHGKGQLANAPRHQYLMMEPPYALDKSRVFIIVFFFRSLFRPTSG